MKLFPASTTQRITRTEATTPMNIASITELILPWIDPSQFLHIKHTLEWHGGTLTIHESAYHLTFPGGTIQKDLPQREGMPRQKIIFPDGWWFLYEHASGSRLPKLIVDAAQGEQPGA